MKVLATRCSTVLKFSYDKSNHVLVELQTQNIIPKKANDKAMKLAKCPAKQEFFSLDGYNIGMNCGEAAGLEHVEIT